MKFTEYLIETADKIDTLTKQIQDLSNRYQRIDHPSRSESDDYNKQISDLKNKINKLNNKHTDKDAINKQKDAINKQVDTNNYERAKEYLKKNLPKLEKLKQSSEHQEKLKTGFKRGSWQVAVLQGDIDKAQKTVDNYKK